MYQEVIVKLLRITDSIPWFRACDKTNMFYDKELDKIIIDLELISLFL